MKDHVIAFSRDSLTLVLAGLGISFAPHQFFGGLFLALAAGSLVARHRKSGKRFLTIMTTAAFTAIVTVIATQSSDHFGYPPQLIMAGAGAGSSWMINFFIRLMDEAAARGGTIAARLIDKLLPPDDGRSGRREGESE